jgi:ribonuclease HI
MKQLKFEHQFAKQIVSGEKTATLRINDDKAIVVGDTIELVDKVDRDHPTTWQVRGALRITDSRQIPIKNLTKEDFLRVESFSDTHEMIELFRRFYGDHITDTTLVTVFGFEFHLYDSPRAYLDPVVGNASIPSSVKLYADGGSRGNPGPSAAGFVVTDMQDAVLHIDNKYLGITTNNQAEYHAVLAGMEWCRAKGVQEIHIYLDSLLVVNQMKGIFKVKNRDLWSLYESSLVISKEFRKITFSHIPRELNKLADQEVNKALDAVKGRDVVQ